MTRDPETKKISHAGRGIGMSMGELFHRRLFHDESLRLAAFGVVKQVFRGCVMANPGHLARLIAERQLRLVKK